MGARNHRMKHMARRADEPDDGGWGAPSHKFGGCLHGKPAWFETKQGAPLCKQPIPETKHPVLVPDDDDSLTLTPGGSVTAAGENTFADSSIEGQVIDKGAYTLAIGSCIFKAAAEAGDGIPAFASATSFAGAEGADFFFSFNSVVTGADCDPATESQMAKSFVIAIDIHGWDFAGGPMEFDFSSNIDSRHLFEDIADLNFADFTSDVNLDKDVDVDVFVDSDADEDGNVATLEGTVEAIGYDTLAELTFTVTTVEDQLSEVSVVAVIRSRLRPKLGKGILLA